MLFAEAHGSSMGGLLSERCARDLAGKLAVDKWVARV